MTRQTPAPTRPIPMLYPQLAPLARAAVRLHPRPATSDVPASASKIGGPILWPRAEPWPTCHDVEYAMQQVELAPDDPFYVNVATYAPHFLTARTVHRGVGVGPDDARHTGIFLPVLQIRRSDVPELPFPDGSDLFQMIWCSRLHLPGMQPNVHVAWRTESTLTETRAEFPAPTRDETHPDPHVDDCLIPRRVCILQPERVIEYPSLRELQATQVIDADTLDDLFEESHSGALGTAYGGTKIGGYPAWIQDPRWPQCVHGHAMMHLMTFDSDEPLNTLTLSLDELEQMQQAGQDRRMHYQPTGMLFGRAGRMYVFYCPECPDHPLALETQ